jgi:hypothetical protein
MHFSVAGESLRRLFAAAVLLPAATIPASVMVNTFLRMQTDPGGIDIELFNTQALGGYSTR